MAFLYCRKLFGHVLTLSQAEWLAICDHERKEKKEKKGRYKKKLIREMVNFFKATFFFFCFLVHGLLLYVFARYRRSRRRILVFLMSMLSFSKKVLVFMMRLAHKIDSKSHHTLHCSRICNSALLQILLGRGIHIDFSSQLKFAKIGFYGAFHL